MTNELQAKLSAAIELLNEVEEAPRPDWWNDVFKLSGEHMVRTEEGWQPGSVKQEIIEEYGSEHILEEANAPQVEVK